MILVLARSVRRVSGRVAQVGTTAPTPWLRRRPGFSARLPRGLRVLAVCRESMMSAAGWPTLVRLAEASDRGLRRRSGSTVLEAEERGAVRPAFGTFTAAVSRKPPTGRHRVQSQSQPGEVDESFDELRASGAIRGVWETLSSLRSAVSSPGVSVDVRDNNLVSTTATVAVCNPGGKVETEDPEANTTANGVSNPRQPNFAVAAHPPAHMGTCPLTIRIFECRTIRNLRARNFSGKDTGLILAHQ
jgi:hypothetical protein